MITEKDFSKYIYQLEQELDDLRRLFFEFYSYFRATTLMPSNDNKAKLEEALEEFRNKYLLNEVQGYHLQSK